MLLVSRLRKRCKGDTFLAKDVADFDGVPWEAIDEGIERRVGDRYLRVTGEHVIFGNARWNDGQRRVPLN